MSKICFISMIVLILSTELTLQKNVRQSDVLYIFQIIKLFYSELI